MSTMQQSYGLTIHTPIDRVVLLISTRLGLNDGHDYKLERWIKLLKDNWIQTVGALARLDDGMLDKLNLPLGLKIELEKIGNLSFEKKNFFHVQEEGLVDSRYHLNLGEKQKELIHHSFKMLLKYQDTVTEQSGLRRFEKEFFPNFFVLYPGAQRLFNESNMDFQGKAFVRMLYWIIENMESKDLSNVIIQLGGRHVIYQVAVEEFEFMSVALCDTLEQILGTKIMNQESRSAWKEMLKQMAHLLIMGGAQCEKGFSRSCKRQKGSGSWEVCQFNLSIDILYLYKDKTMKTLIGQYPLKGVQAIEFTKDTEMKHVLQIASFDPPFTVYLAAPDEEQFKEWVGEFSWRIQAIQRAFFNDDSKSIGDASSRSEEESSSGRFLESNPSQASLPGIGSVKKTSKSSSKDSDSKKAKKQVSHKTSTSTKKQVDTVQKTEEDLKELLAKGLTVTAEQKVVLKASWTTLIEKKKDDGGITKSGIGLLFEKFYPSFFQENPSGRRLFEHSGLQVQGRALVLMVGMIIKALDSFQTFADVVVQLGGRHEIYGVNEGDYECFARVLSNSIAEIVGENIEEVKSAWFDCMMSLSQIMRVSQKIALNTKEFFICHRRIGGPNSWKQSAVRFALDSIYIFNGVEAAKLRSAINFKSIRDVEQNLSKDETEDFPAPYSFMISHGVDEKAYFSFETEEQCLKQLESLSWRYQAQQRVFKYVAEDAVSDDQSEKSSSKLHFFEKKKKSSK